MFVSISVCGAACFCQSLPVCVGFSHREGTVVADHYRERDCGRWEFSRVCLWLGPLLNEQCSILLIMLLWLMSLSADSEECNKTLFLFGLFAFLIGVNKRAFFTSCPAIHILRSGWHLCGVFFFLLLFYVYICIQVRFCFATCGNYTFGLQFVSLPTALFHGLHS